MTQPNYDPATMANVRRLLGNELSALNLNLPRDLADIQQRCKQAIAAVETDSDIPRTFVANLAPIQDDISRRNTLRNVLALLDAAVVKSSPQ